MNAIQLSALGITVKSPDNELRIDGVVDSIRDHAIKILRGIQCPEDKFDSTLDLIVGPFGGDGFGGRAIRFELSDGNNKWFIFYSNYSNQSIETYVRGHEETHVLHGIGQISMLQEPLRSLGVNVGLAQYTDCEGCTSFSKEFVASLGGLYAVRRNRLRMWVVHSKRKELNVTERMALDAAISAHYRDIARTQTPAYVRFSATPLNGSF